MPSLLKKFIRAFAGVAALWLAIEYASPTQAAEEVIRFDSETVGKPITGYTNSGVIFIPAHAATRSTAVPRIMFFPHLKTSKKGILSAMADDPIPVKIEFPRGASSVTLVMWGSTDCPAQVEAFDKNGKRVDRASLPAVPARTSPADPVPSFEMTVKAPEISFVCFSGPRVGEYLAAEEVRYVPLDSDRPAQSPTDAH
jgi:hypothetical protein